MKITRHLTLAFSLAVFANAQTPPDGSTAIVLPGPMYEEVKQYLTLTDGQLTALRQIQNEQGQANNAVYLQINQRQQSLNQLLQSGSQDSVQIGRLMVEINNLRKQVPVDAGPYRTRALAVLTEPQKAKLPALIEALKLNSPAWQAASLLLIDSPEPPVRILPASLEATGAEATVSGPQLR